jgi:hypothetical protein
LTILFGNTVFPLIRPSLILIPAFQGNSVSVITFLKIITKTSKQCHRIARN